MFRLIFTLFALLALTVSQDVPELEPFDPDEFDQAFGRLTDTDDDDDDDED